MGKARFSVLVSRANSANFNPTSDKMWSWNQQYAQPVVDADGDLTVVYDGYGPDVSEADVTQTITSLMATG